MRNPVQELIMTKNKTFKINKMIKNKKNLK